MSQGSDGIIRLSDFQVEGIDFKESLWPGRYMLYARVEQKLFLIHTIREAEPKATSGDAVPTG